MAKASCMAVSQLKWGSESLESGMKENQTCDLTTSGWVVLHLLMRRWVLWPSSRRQRSNAYFRCVRRLSRNCIGEVVRKNKKSRNEWVRLDVSVRLYTRHNNRSAEIGTLPKRKCLVDSGMSRTRTGLQPRDVSQSSDRYCEKHRLPTACG